MFTRFEDFAACRMLGQPDSPPRSQGALYFAHVWQRQVYGLALAVSKEGHFEWEDFRQALIAAISEWEQGAPEACAGQPRWDYYERYLEALLKVLRAEGIVDTAELQRCLPAMDAR